MGCSFSGLNALYDAVSVGDVWINENRFKVGRHFGKGGFAYVFLVKELLMDNSSPSGGLAKKLKDPSFASDDGTYAMKKVLSQNTEKLELVREEIRVSSLFTHRNLLPLLDYAIIPVKSLRLRGIQFPGRDTKSVAPNFTPASAISEPVTNPAFQGRSSPVLPTFSAEQIKEVFNVARNNIELLSTVLSSSLHQDVLKDDLTTTLAQQCRSSRSTIQRIIATSGENEALLKTKAVMCCSRSCLLPTYLNFFHVAVYKVTHFNVAELLLISLRRFRLI